MSGRKTARNRERQAQINYDRNRERRQEEEREMNEQLKEYFGQYPKNATERGNMIRQMQEAQEEQARLNAEEYERMQQQLNKLIQMHKETNQGNTMANKLKKELTKYYKSPDMLKKYLRKKGINPNNNTGLDPRLAKAVDEFQTAAPSFNEVEGVGVGPNVNVPYAGPSLSTLKYAANEGYLNAAPPPAPPPASPWGRGGTLKRKSRRKTRKQRKTRKY
jgi:hypothetical protein